MMDFKLGYDDISLVPERITNIRSRSECNAYDENGMLPIWASPMDTVICEENIQQFLDSKINVIIPRNIDFCHRVELAKKSDVFFAVSISEAYDICRFYSGEYGSTCMRTDEGYKICVDIANGHMGDLLDVCRRLKSFRNARLTIMTGNIANPETYIDYEDAGVDYVRCTIGSGSACLTASCTGVFYPPFSLIKEVYEIRKRIGGRCKIIADGGIKEFRHIQRALVYADYVMIGGLFNKAIESAGKTTYGKSYWNVNGNKIFRPLKTLFTYGKEIPREKFDKAFADFKAGKLVIWKQYRGMSTKQAQRNIDPNAKLKTAEGKVFYQKVEYNLAGWAENETDYLRSAMSYTNSYNLSEFKESKYVINMSVNYNK